MSSFQPLDSLARVCVCVCLCACGACVCVLGDCIPCEVNLSDIHSIHVCGER